MKARLIAAAATLAFLPAFAQVSGSYDVTGKDVDGKPYKGKLSASKNGQTLKLRYSSGKSYNGVGVEKGSLLFSAWGPSDKCGMGVYEIKDGAAGDGMYADIGHPQVGREVLKRTAGSGEVNGTYEIAGKDFDGVPFAGLVKVEPRGPVYKLSFKTAGEEYDGIGMTFANHLVVGWGGKGCAVAAYEMKADNTGTGKYAEFGVGKLGEETLMKSF